MNYSISLIIMGEYRQQNKTAVQLIYCCSDISGIFNVILGKLLLEQHSHMITCRFKKGS